MSNRSNGNSQLIHLQNNGRKRSHDNASLTPTTDVLRPEKRQRFGNGQEGQGQAFLTPITSWMRPLLDRKNQGSGLTGYLPGYPDADVIADIGTRGSHPQAQVHNVSPQSPHVAGSANVKQTSTLFHGAHNFQISGSPSFVTTHVHKEKDGLEHLKGFVSLEAQLDSSIQDPERLCHPGTRENVLKWLRDWVDNPKAGERMLWLHGPAGAGKSAIAQTLASLYARPRVAATFFFFKSDVNRNDGNRLFTTLAYQLALSIPALKNHIANSLNERPDLPETGVETQFNHLLARPFQVLNDDATRQLAPVIVIDGVDECMDENLQRRFLKVINDAVKDDHFPIRFLIVSRPELHIEKIIRRFQPPIPTIDLATLDDANRDIEKYLVDEFSRIAFEQDLDPTWPGPNVIGVIVSKSSGNFIYASIVIHFVGDPYCFAKTQLKFVMNIQLPKEMSPWAELDQLFLEILRRVQDQDFLKRYLALLTARVSVSSGYGDLHKDDAVLMHVSEEELRVNIGRLRSLLTFKPAIDVYHRSFLDFLHNSSRSGQYYTGKQDGIRRYLELFVNSLVRYISTVIEQPDRHSASHFTPRFRAAIKDFPAKIKLTVNQWQEIMQPLLDLQDNLLQVPFASTWYLRRCDDCTVFRLLRELLHLGLHLGTIEGDASVQLVMNVRKRRGVVSSTTTEIKEMNSNELDSLLLSLFASLPEAMENLSQNEEVIKLMDAILHFDSAEVAKRVRFVSDAQKLVDLLVYMIRPNNAPSSLQPAAMGKACSLALKIFARTPILPLSYFLNESNTSCRYIWWNNTIPTQILSQTIFASTILHRYYIVPMFRGNKAESALYFPGDMQGGSVSTLAKWRGDRIIILPVTVRHMMLELAKTIQYFHSLDIVLHHEFGSGNVYLDRDLRQKICCWCSILLEQPWEAISSPADNVFSFGCIFFELFSGVDTKTSNLKEERRRIVTQRKSSPRIPEYPRQLIERCCDLDPGSRPVIHEIVQELENWKI